MKIFNTVLYRVRMWRKCDLKYYQNHQNNAYPLFYYINNLVMENMSYVKAQGIWSQVQWQIFNLKQVLAKSNLFNSRADYMVFANLQLPYARFASRH